MKILCCFGKSNYGDQRRGESYEYSNMMPAFSRLGHEVDFFDIWDRGTFRNFAELNGALLKQIEDSRPNVVFFVLRQCEVWLETLHVIRETNSVRSAIWGADDDWRYLEFSRFLAPAVDAYATTYRHIYERFLHSGLRNVLLTQWAANAEFLAPPKPAKDCHFKVTFIGTAHGDRPKLVARLQDKRIKVACFGYGWPNGPVPSVQIPEIIRDSVISLNFANSGGRSLPRLADRHRQIKARVFDIPGAGGFLLTESADGLRDFYNPGKEIEVFDSFEDLVWKIEHCLAHPGYRDELAVAGFERTREEHTYDKRMESLLRFINDQSFSARPQTLRRTDVSVNWDVFNRAASLHQPGRFMLGVKQLLLTLCKVIWGPERGPRAARQLVFEFSWRLLGKKSYTAAGPSGRLFYSES